MGMALDLFDGSERASRDEDFHMVPRPVNELLNMLDQDGAFCLGHTHR